MHQNDTRPCLDEAGFRYDEPIRPQHIEGDPNCKCVPCARDRLSRSRWADRQFLERMRARGNQG